MRTHAHERSAALRHVAVQIDRRADDFAHVITSESGKPMKWSRAEVARAISTFEWASEEARRWSGELLRLDTAPGSEGRVALVRRFPRGTIVGVTPFNFPLNLVGAGDRGRCADHREAIPSHAAVGDRAQRARGRDEPPLGAALHDRRRQRPGPGSGRRCEGRGGLVHRIGSGRLVAASDAAEEEKLTEPRTLVLTGVAF